MFVVALKLIVMMIFIYVFFLSFLLRMTTMARLFRSLNQETKLGNNILFNAVFRDGSRRLSNESSAHFGNYYRE